MKADGTVELGETSDAEIKDGKLVVTDQKKPEVPTVTTKKVVFSKQNVAGEEIAGAKIQIKQGDKVVESWTSEAGKSQQVSLTQLNLNLELTLSTKKQHQMAT